MVDLRQLLAKGGGDPIVDPLQIFEGLDRKTSHVNLRPFQITALQNLHARRSERDLVLKMPTGSGKSTVGLLYLRSHMAETGGAGVYLCPTLQLSEQVLVEAGRLGLDAHPYPGGQRYPHADCLAGKAIVVCTYDKLFNANTTFDRWDVRVVPAALVLDDAHAGVEEVRDAFTLRIENADAMKKFVEILDAGMKDHMPTSWKDVIEGDPRVVLEVPYWHLADVQDELSALVKDFAEQADRDLRWPLIRNSMPTLRCVVGRGTIEFTVDVPAVRLLRPYQEAKHRLFMSGTLSDDTVLVRELDCSTEAALKPVVPSTESGIGERMVLAPALLDPAVMKRDWVIAWAAEKAREVSVVVLCSSSDDAAAWRAAGALTPIRHDEVSRAVKALRSGELKFAAFAQRFDGVDLPDDACRVLIIDGIPRGQSLCDDADSAAFARDGGVRNRVVYRIEQGMGRAVRSSADYAVIVLAGDDLASFVSLTSVRSQMSPEVQAQLALGRDLIELARASGGASVEEAFNDIVSKSLGRSKDWKEIYNDRVRKQVAGQPPRPDDTGIRLAYAERTAYMRAIDGDAPSAVEVLSTALNDAKLPQGPAYARYLQTLARLQFMTDRDEGIRIQRQAHGQSPRLLRPPPVRTGRPRDVAVGAAADGVLRWYAQFAEGQGAVAEVTRTLNDLNFGVAHTAFENAVETVGEIIGARSTRPERDEKEGPDNLWRWKDQNLLIEVKSKTTATSISKSNLGQIAMSTTWFEQTYPGESFVPVMMIDSSEADVEPDKRLRVMTGEGLDELKKRVLNFVQRLAAKPARNWVRTEVAALLDSSGLSPARLLNDVVKTPRKQRS